MTNKIITIIQNSLHELPLIYAFIGGSYNTSLRHDRSDVDLFLVWEHIPSKEMRTAVLDRLEKLSEQHVEWSYLDEESEVMRDATKIARYPKIEVYHNSFSSFQYALSNQDSQDGLSFSITNRLPILSLPTLEHFIESHSIDRTEEIQSTFFAIMGEYQNQSSAMDVYNNILKLYSLQKYRSLPSKKHSVRVAAEIPDNELLKTDTSSWIQKNRKLLTNWGRVSPAEINSKGKISIKRQHSNNANTVFERVQAQKLRLQEFLNWPVHINTVEDQLNFSAKAELQWKEGQAFHFQIFSENLFAGAISIHSINYSNRSFEFGYWVDSNSEGKGLVHQGLQLLMKTMADKGWKMAKIRTTHDNTRSQRVAKKIGMTEESKTEHFMTFSLSLSRSQI